MEEFSSLKFLKTSGLFFFKQQVHQLLIVTLPLTEPLLKTCFSEENRLITYQTIQEWTK